MMVLKNRHIKCMNSYITGMHRKTSNERYHFHGNDFMETNNDQLSIIAYAHLPSNNKPEVFSQPSLHSEESIIIDPLENCRGGG